MESSLSELPVREDTRSRHGSDKDNDSAETNTISIMSTPTFTESHPKRAKIISNTISFQDRLQPRIRLHNLHIAGNKSDSAGSVNIKYIVEDSGNYKLENGTKGENNSSEISNRPLLLKKSPLWVKNKKKPYRSERATERKNQQTSTDNDSLLTIEVQEKDEAAVVASSQKDIGLLENSVLEEESASNSDPSVCLASFISPEERTGDFEKIMCSSSGKSSVLETKRETEAFAEECFLNSMKYNTAGCLPENRMDTEGSESSTTLALKTIAEGKNDSNSAVEHSTTAQKVNFIRNQSVSDRIPTENSMNSIQKKKKEVTDAMVQMVRVKPRPKIGGNKIHSLNDSNLKLSPSSRDVTHSSTFILRSQAKHGLSFTRKHLSTAVPCLNFRHRLRRVTSKLPVRKADNRFKRFKSFKHMRFTQSKANSPSSSVLCAAMLKPRKKKRISKSSDCLNSVQGDDFQTASNNHAAANKRIIEGTQNGSHILKSEPSSSISQIDQICQSIFNSFPDRDINKTSQKVEFKDETGWNENKIDNIFEKFRSSFQNEDRFPVSLKGVTVRKPSNDEVIEENIATPTRDTCDDPLTEEIGSIKDLRGDFDSDSTECCKYDDLDQVFHDNGAAGGGSHLGDGLLSHSENFYPDIFPFDLESDSDNKLVVDESMESRGLELLESKQTLEKSLLDADETDQLKKLRSTAYRVYTRKKNQLLRLRLNKLTDASEAKWMLATTADEKSHEGRCPEEDVQKVEEEWRSRRRNAHSSRKTKPKLKAMKRRKTSMNSQSTSTSALATAPSRQSTLMERKKTKNPRKMTKICKEFATRSKTNKTKRNVDGVESNETDIGSETTNCLESLLIQTDDNTGRLDNKSPMTENSNKIILKKIREGGYRRKGRISDKKGLTSGRHSRLNRRSSGKKSESEEGSRQSKMDILSRELGPRYNWLEQKIQAMQKGGSVPSEIELGGPETKGQTLDFQQGSFEAGAMKRTSSQISYESDEDLGPKTKRRPRKEPSPRQEHTVASDYTSGSKEIEISELTALDENDSLYTTAARSPTPSHCSRDFDEIHSVDHEIAHSATSGYTIPPRTLPKSFCFTSMTHSITGPTTSILPLAIPPTSDKASPSLRLPPDSSPLSLPLPVSLPSPLSLPLPVLLPPPPPPPLSLPFLVSLPPLSLPLPVSLPPLSLPPASPVSLSSHSFTSRLFRQNDSSASELESTSRWNFFTNSEQVSAADSDLDCQIPCDLSLPAVRNKTTELEKRTSSRSSDEDQNASLQMRSFTKTRFESGSPENESPRTDIRQSLTEAHLINQKLLATAYPDASPEIEKSSGREPIIDLTIDPDPLPSPISSTIARVANDPRSNQCQSLEDQQNSPSARNTPVLRLIKYEYSRRLEIYEKLSKVSKIKDQEIAILECERKRVKKELDCLKNVFHRASAGLPPTSDVGLDLANQANYRLLGVAPMEERQRSRDEYDGEHMDSVHRAEAHRRDSMVKMVANPTPPLAHSVKMDLSMYTYLRCQYKRDMPGNDDSDSIYGARGPIEFYSAAETNNPQSDLKFSRSSFKEAPFLDNDPTARSNSQGSHTWFPEQSDENTKRIGQIIDSKETLHSEPSANDTTKSLHPNVDLTSRRLSDLDLPRKHLVSQDDEKKWKPAPDLIELRSSHKITSSTGLPRNVSGFCSEQQQQHLDTKDLTTKLDYAKQPPYSAENITHITPKDNIAVEQLESNLIFQDVFDKVNRRATEQHLELQEDISGDSATPRPNDISDKATEEGLFKDISEDHVIDLSSGRSSCFSDQVDSLMSTRGSNGVVTVSEAGRQSARDMVSLLSENVESPLALDKKSHSKDTLPLPDFSRSRSTPMEVRGSDELESGEVEKGGRPGEDEQTLDFSLSREFRQKRTLPKSSERISPEIHENIRRPSAENSNEKPYLRNRETFWNPSKPSLQKSSGDVENRKQEPVDLKVISNQTRSSNSALMLTAPHPGISADPGKVSENISVSDSRSESMRNYQQQSAGSLIPDSISQRQHQLLPERERARRVAPGLLVESSVSKVDLPHTDPVTSEKGIASKASRQWHRDAKQPLSASTGINSDLQVMNMMISSLNTDQYPSRSINGPPEFRRVSLNHMNPNDKDHLKSSRSANVNSFHNADIAQRPYSYRNDKYFGQSYPTDPQLLARFRRPGSGDETGAHYSKHSLPPPLARDLASGQSAPQTDMEALSHHMREPSRFDETHRKVTNNTASTIHRYNEMAQAMTHRDELQTRQLSTGRHSDVSPINQRDSAFVPLPGFRRDSNLRLPVEQVQQQAPAQSQYIGRHTNSDVYPMPPHQGSGGSAPLSRYGEVHQSQHQQQRLCTAVPAQGMQQALRNDRMTLPINQKRVSQVSPEVDNRLVRQADVASSFRPADLVEKSQADQRQIREHPRETVTKGTRPDDGLLSLSEHKNNDNSIVIRHELLAPTATTQEPGMKRNSSSDQMVYQHRFTGTDPARVINWRTGQAMQHAGKDYNGRLMMPRGPENLPGLGRNAPTRRPDDPMGTLIQPPTELQLSGSASGIPARIGQARAHSSGGETQAEDRYLPSYMEVISSTNISQGNSYRSMGIMPPPLPTQQGLPIRQASSDDARIMAALHHQQSLQQQSLQQQSLQQQQQQHQQQELSRLPNMRDNMRLFPGYSAMANAAAATGNPAFLGNNIPPPGPLQPGYDPSKHPADNFDPSGGANRYMFDRVPMGHGRGGLVYPPASVPTSLTNAMGPVRHQQRQEEQIHSTSLPATIEGYRLQQLQQQQQQQQQHQHSGQAPKPIDYICEVCRTPAMFVCSACKNVAYCSTECQAISWQTRHSTVCKQP